MTFRKISGEDGGTEEKRKGVRKKGRDRTKPWGTGQAILCCKDVVKEPFLVINADDYYGKEAYRVIYEYLVKGQETKRKDDSCEQLDICMAGFVLKNTLSSNGTVTRGICSVDRDGMLTDIEETFDIAESDGFALAQRDGKKIKIPLETSVSMNMWGLPVEFFSKLEYGFAGFLSRLDEQELKKEYLLPQIIGELVQNKKAKVKVLPSHDKWFGVTYKEDKETVVEAVRSLIAQGKYPEKLFEKYN